MATNLVPVTAGATEKIRHRLKNDDGTYVSIFSMTAELVLQDKNGDAIDTDGKVEIIDDDVTADLVGAVEYSPDEADFDDTLSPYTWKWKITDGDGKIFFFPNAAPAHLKVYPQGQ